MTFFHLPPDLRLLDVVNWLPHNRHYSLKQRVTATNDPIPHNKSKLTLPSPQPSPPPSRNRQWLSVHETGRTE